MSIVISPKQLVAHRGHRECFPENSMLAILDAIAAGAKHIEFDIQITKEGIPILYHDDDMQRISGIHQSILNLTIEQFPQYAVSEPERLGEAFFHNPLEMLSDLFPIIEKHQNIQFFMEVKEDSLQALGQAFYFDALKFHLPRITDNLILISFNAEVVKLAREYGFLKTGLVFRDWENRNQLLKEAAADYGFINYKRIPEQDKIKADKPLIVYEVCDSVLAQQLLNRGATAVETFCIRKLLNV